MTNQDAAYRDAVLSVVETDGPTEVRMFNGSGCEIGEWEYADWCNAIAFGQIILQPGDVFRFE